MKPFEWGVACEGYAWHDAFPIEEGADTPPSRFLMPVSPSTRRWRTWLPMERPEVAPLFASVPPTEEGIQTFANTYGSLGWQEPIRFFDGSGNHGERFESWCRAISTMRHVLLVWEAIQAHDQETLTRWFTRGSLAGQSIVIYHPETPPPSGTEVVMLTSPSDRSREPLLAEYHPWYGRGGQFIRESATSLDPRGLALAWLQCRIDTYLARFTYVCVWPPVGEPTTSLLELEIMPKTLLGALWLQLVYALRGTERYQRCPACGNWFHVHVKARRPNTTYCTTRCRVRASRKRHAAGGHPA